MPLPKNNPVSDESLYVFNPVGGTPTGSRMNASIPKRGRLIEVGFVPNSIVTSAITLAVAISSPTASNASNFTQVVTSTLGTFSSVNTYEGACCSVIPASAVLVRQGDAIQWTTSGGQTSAVGVTCYAIIKRG